MYEDLTYSEKEVLYFLIQGYNYKYIICWLGINYKEYKKIKKSLLKKMNAKRRTQLLTIILQEGINIKNL